MAYSPVTRQQVEEFAKILRKCIMASLRANATEVDFGHPCAYLIDEVTRHDIETVAGRILRGPGEYRLNGAGLKFYVQVSPEGKITVKVAGDQYHHYEKTGPALNEILRTYGYQKD